MKYLIFADKAEHEEFKNIAGLFKAIAFAERVHASNHLQALNGSSLTIDNLDIAINGENFEVNEMYPSYKTVAELQDEKTAVKSMHYALEAEKTQAMLYSEAKKMLKTGRDKAGCIISQTCDDRNSTEYQQTQKLFAAYYLRLSRCSRDQK